MQKLFVPVGFAALLLFSCGSNGKEKNEDAGTAICKADCLKDSLKFGDEGKGRAYVYVTPKSCGIDSIFWGTHGMGTVRGAAFNRPEFKANKDKMRFLYNGGNYAYLLMNDCETRKGLVAKLLMVTLPAEKQQTFMLTGKGINNGNPKFSVADNLVVTCDGGNLLIDDVSTGKQSTMTFGKWIQDIDYDAIHEYIDSVNVTNTKGWAKVKIDGKWTTVEKNLEFK